MSKYERDLINYEQARSFAEYFDKTFVRWPLRVAGPQLNELDEEEERLLYEAEVLRARAARVRVCRCEIAPCSAVM